MSNNQEEQYEDQEHKKIQYPLDSTCYRIIDEIGRGVLCSLSFAHLSLMVYLSPASRLSQINTECTIPDDCGFE
ncbi:hypothetical protein RND71_013852 [Anisodus tanguticus]|uniref:Uncharacterized protein n=1 Tax=Anisodus tanguticus TaxID=243964 RepID=A0AAE1SAR6_9SOLA|nr:hypothetical protein RND71_013852 [Anisodus tanguticus]